jgi:hypothetical protein
VILNEYYPYGPESFFFLGPELAVAVRVEQYFVGFFVCGCRGFFLQGEKLVLEFRVHNVLRLGFH